MKPVFKYSSKYNLIKRFAVSPFFLLVIIVVAIISSIRTFVMFLRFGGEHVVYNENDYASIDKIYQELKNKENETVS